jgi:hypothetical protein
VKNIVLRHDQGTPKDSPEFVGFRSFSAGNATGSGRNYAWPVQRLTANLFGREERNLRKPITSKPRDLEELRVVWMGDDFPLGRE